MKKYYTPERINIPLTLAVMLFFPFINSAQLNVTTANNVGIGTTAPSSILSVESSASGSTGIDITNTAGDGDPRISFKFGALTLFTMGVDDSDADKFKIGTTAVESSTKLTIESSGNVGIGTTAPGYLLEANDIINSKGGKLYAARKLADYSTRRNWGIITEAHAQGDFTINESISNSAEPTETRFCILRGGNVGIGTDNPGYTLDINGTAHCTSGAWSSDSTKKKNIQNLSMQGINVIKQLRPVTYEWKTAIDPGMLGTEMGFIAQELEQVLPSMVITRNDSIGNATKSVKFLELLPVIVKSIQEQQSIIDSLLSLPTAKKTSENNDSLMREIENLKSLVNQCCTANPNQTGNSTGDNSKGNIHVELANKNNVVLYQNEPNPFSNQTIIRYFIPENLTEVFVIFHDEFGREVNKVRVTEKGFGKIEATTENLASGIYTYSIVADGKTVDTKKMVSNR